MKIALKYKDSWLVVLWAVSIIVYTSFIPTIINSNIFPSIIPTIVIFCAIIIIPILKMKYSEEKKDKESK